MIHGVDQNSSEPPAVLQVASKAIRAGPPCLQARFIGLEAERLMRKDRVSKRAKLLLQSAAAPARMAEYLKVDVPFPCQLAFW